MNARILLLVLLLLSGCGGGDDGPITDTGPACVPRNICTGDPQNCVYDNPGKTNPPVIKP